MTQTSISSTPGEYGVTLYTLRNAHDMRVLISDRGATLVSWWAPDRYGRVADILLGYPDEDGYQANPSYFGSLVGRWGNRIAKGRFTVDGAEYLVDRNNGNNHLHGGDTGFHLAQWRAEPGPDGLRLTLESPDGDGGYPGHVQASVLYSLDDNGRLSIDYSATSDAPTPLNLTSHGYFNLNGGSSDIYDHILAIAADQYLQIDGQLIPTGAADVAGSALDFRQPAPIGPRLAWPDTQLKLAGGFDHCYCLRPQDGAAHVPGQGRSAQPLRDVATVYDPGSGRQLSVATTENGLQFYSGNFLEGIQGRGAKPYAIHDGFCLEAQAYPDQINSADAEAVILRPGQVYRQTTTYQISVR
ncbi:aldose epimerase family protein [Collimonas fungivorans]|uniref:Aldose 1-epimerase n=1 Tax=Collimonas fungivorans (strain Ter331) TaxID=1005048 RepID=G0AA48_COLFT|nr:aldose epimerase family protein [Collimonas fungivorans]AEK62982.1 D-xylose-specific 1-epimerase (mutarotase) [Collimonas fungivorans Ter331]